MYANTCESIIFCFLELFDDMFKSNGGMGGWL